MSGKGDKAVIEKLSPDQQVLIRLQTYEGLTYREIAISMGKSEDFVKSGLARARVSLRQLLNRAEINQTSGKL